MLALERVSKSFLRGTPNEVRALRDVDLAVAAGDFVTVIGSNGAGKSTMIKAVAGFAIPDEGRILLEGRDITRRPPWRRAATIGRIAQDPNESTCAGMTIEENLAMAERRGRPRGLRLAIRGDARRRFRDALAPIGLGLEDRLASRVGLLSGGQRQALALLMATLSGSRLLLLDEHLAALDPKTAETVMRLTDRLIAERRLTALMITHNMQDAIRWGNRLLMMHGGRIVLDVGGAEKAALTVQMLVDKFHAVSHAEMVEDRVLLTA
ncbi:ATP-binding cassette domain-containing protein [Rhizobiales bacterium L72]|uniref:ATP-binding cassette domain-containing protein n=2 Tax=Propylenella binzhouense TaxID=2555902 RepID=A0A964T532_9HYPH|nr:ATP-binding cassette domain-containing protein [Propylenella binzhouense]MYZ48613.1 ATP-binding cassette domain-containing protein [Propylenella binzhouense]